MTLPECRFRHKHPSNLITCTSDALSFGVSMPVEAEVICLHCPIPEMLLKSETKQDSPTQMLTLSVDKPRSLGYTAKPKPCSTCPDKFTTVVPALEGKRSSVRTGTLRREGYMSRAYTVHPIDPPRDRDWAVVVTTSPRKEPTIEQSINSIKAAGWNPVVFAEPDSIHLPDTRYVANPVRLGAWFNWLKSVQWALKNTIAEYIMTVQDDSLFHPDSRSFVESVMWPSRNVGFLSLYTAAHYSADFSGNPKPYGINKISTSALWGACALVFPRSVLQTMLEHPVLKDWKGVAPKNMDNDARVNFNKRREEAPHTIQNVDSAIGTILTSLHLEMYMIDPSPVKHIAVHSAIGHGGNTGKRNCGRCADHSASLAQQVFPDQRDFTTKKGIGSKILKVMEKEIGYKITCETCLTFFHSIDSNKYSDIKDLVLQIFANGSFPDEWRKKYIGRTKRLERIEELIKPLIEV